MNISLRVIERDTAINVFTWIWLIGSIAVSGYFAFSLFPSVYGETQSATVQIYFKTKNEADKTIYYPNKMTYRGQHHDALSDLSFLYFDACEAAPRSQRPICDDAGNWREIEPASLDCSDAKNCETTEYRLNAVERDRYLTGLTPKEGKFFTVTDKGVLSISNPIGWGYAARWPLFFIALFLALRLGRMLGEFTFLAYEA